MEKPIYALLSVLIAAMILMGVMEAAYADEPDPIEAAFAEAADHYEIDKDILIAIATLESGYGTSAIAKNKNNWFGWMRYDGTEMAFETVEDGIYHVARAISRRPHDSVEEIAAWYNAPYAKTWAERVDRILGE